MWDTAAWSLAFLNVSSAEGSPRRLAVPGREPPVYLLYSAVMKRKQRCLSSVLRRKVGVSDPAGQFTPEKDPVRMMGVLGIWWRGCLWTPRTDFCLLTGCTF